jgi:acetylornithine deacetylase/succinyl-diaminopimelate desuccinylase-like protein
MTGRDAALARAGAWVEDGGFQADLARLVAIPSESQRADSGPDLHRYLAEGILPWCDRLGMAATIHPNPAGGPILTAERIEDATRPTILIYGHGDVVDGQAGRWSADRDPFTVCRDGDRLYGRGTADNKGQHLINLAALGHVLAARGRLGFNVRLLIETGEETGSAGLEEFVRAHADTLAADALIASDGPRLDPSIPTLFTGSRGAVNFRLVADLRAGAHHSGNWGGVLADPMILLAHAIASITDARGALAVPEWRPDSLTPAISALIRDLPVSGDLSPDWGEPGLSPAERLFGWNAFAVLAIDHGNPDSPQSAIAGRAVATCQLRFVVGTDAGDILPALRRHLDRHGHAAVVIEADGAPAPATRLDPDSPWCRFAAASLAATEGRAPHVLPNLGGFIPNHVFADILGQPTIWVPHSYSGCSQHAPDEHVLLPTSRSAARVMTGLFWDLGETAPA